MRTQSAVPATAPTEPVDRWKAVTESFNEAIDQARREPAEAEQLYRFLTLRPNNEDEARQLLADISITDYPSSHNPELNRSRTIE